MPTVEENLVKTLVEAGIKRIYGIVRPNSVLPSGSFDHPASDAGSAATKRCRSVGIVIAPSVYHDRATAHILNS